MTIPRLKERVASMLFKCTFWDRYQSLHKVRFRLNVQYTDMHPFYKQMTSIFDASLSLKSAKSFKELLHASTSAILSRLILLPYYS